LPSLDEITTEPTLIFLIEFLDSVWNARIRIHTFWLAFRDTQPPPRIPNTVDGGGKTHSSPGSKFQLINRMSSPEPFSGCASIRPQMFTTCLRLFRNGSHSDMAFIGPSIVLYVHVGVFGVCGSRLNTRRTIGNRKRNSCGAFKLYMFKLFREGIRQPGCVRASSAKIICYRHSDPFEIHEKYLF